MQTSDLTIAPPEPLILFFDVETSGFRKKNLKADDPNQAWTVQIGLMLSTSERVFHECSVILAPPFENASIHPGAERTHKISLTTCQVGGVSESAFMEYLFSILTLTDLVVCHNYAFDSMFLQDLLDRFVGNDELVGTLMSTPHVCTMKKTTNLCKLPGKFGSYKWPKLEELYTFLFDESFSGAHDALVDVRATRRCYYELKERGVV